MSFIVQISPFVHLFTLTIIFRKRPSGPPKIVRVFRVKKITILREIFFFSNFRGARAGFDPLLVDPPLHLRDQPSET
jgi:hypothetical protein